jgi:hypothetical protein
MATYRKPNIGNWCFFFPYFWLLKPFEITSFSKFLISLFGEISPVQKKRLIPQHVMRTELFWFSSLSILSSRWTGAHPQEE